MRPESYSTAFVLAGGGSLGAVQVGMLLELAADGVLPDLVVGVSAGALNGAFLALEPSIGMMHRMAQLWARVRRSDVMTMSFGTVLALLGLRSHLADACGLRRLLSSGAVIEAVPACTNAVL